MENEIVIKNSDDLNEKINIQIEDLENQKGSDDPKIDEEQTEVISNSKKDEKIINIKENNIIKKEENDMQFKNETKEISKKHEDENKDMIKNQENNILNQINADKGNFLDFKIDI